MKGIFVTIALIFCSVVFCEAQTNTFTFQGRLSDNSAAANGTYQMQFSLYDALSGGTQLGTTITNNTVTVTNGVFTVQLDFSPATPFATGADRWIEMAVRKAADPPGFTLLSPRQQVTSAPYATRAASAANADNAAQLGGVAASQYVVTTDPRMTDARPPTAGSTNYIQNQNAGPQAASNFNINGTGTANIFGAATQYNIGASRILSGVGTNLFTGIGAGSANTGTGNAFFGSSAGGANTGGDDNSFFGSSAGAFNTAGNNGSFFGRRSGLNNTSGINNSFFGADAGRTNTIGHDNAFFGEGSGFNNTTGNFNSYFGDSSGFANTTGGNNAFFGQFSGGGNSTGFRNSFFGQSAGSSNTTGTANTIIGAGANVTSGDLMFATAIGADSLAFASNTIVLGRSTGEDDVHIWGVLRVGLEGSGTLDVCRNASIRLSSCSSSLRYKTNIEPYSKGLKVVRRLTPITFNWKNNGKRDIGFGAEDVAEIEPLLVTNNDAGDIEGVKYKQITTVLVNAVKEQQQMIEKQQTQIEAQQAQINALKELVCAQNPAAKVCRQQGEK